MMTIPAGYKGNQWGWFYKESDNSGPYYLGADGIMHQNSIGKGDLLTDAWGVQKVSLPYSLFSGMFTFDIPQSKWFMYENGVQVYTSTNMTSVGGSARILADNVKTDVVIESRVCPRYQANRGHLFSTALWCPNKTANGHRDWGIGTELNHVVFRLKADGRLYAVVESAGVTRSEDMIDTSSLTGFDVEKNNTYDIQFQWRSAGNYHFYIGNPANGTAKLVHSLLYLGTLTSTSIENPALPVHLQCVSIAGEVEMRVGCVDISTENGKAESLEYGSAYAASVNVSTNTPVLAIRQPLLINDKVNTRDLTLARITLNCSKKATFKVWATRDSTAFTGGTFVSVNQGSFVECDSPDTKATAVRVTAVDTAKLRLITAVNVEATAPRSIDNPWPAGILFPIVRGDYIVVTCTAATAVADCVIEWGEHI